MITTYHFPYFFINLFNKQSKITLWENKNLVITLFYTREKRIKGSLYWKNKKTQGSEQQDHCWISHWDINSLSGLRYPTPTPFLLSSLPYLEKELAPRKLSSSHSCDHRIKQAFHEMCLNSTGNILKYELII